MPNRLLQTAWEQAQHLTPKLSPSITMNRRYYRDEHWYVVQRRGSERLHRINPSAWQVLTLCNGHNTLAQVLQLSQQTEVAAELSAVDLLAVVNQFLTAGLLQCAQQAPANMPASTSADYGGAWWKKLKNPMSMRFPLWDPNRFLNATEHLISPLFSRVVFAVWLFIVLSAMVLAFIHWQAISENVVDRVLRPGNIFWLWLVYPVTKILHEAGHAYATKLYGGAVHETGIVFMFGIPLPYVDASASTAFIHKHQRMLVAAMGIMIELLIGSLALFLWLNIETGLVSQFAYNTMVVCTVATLFFNGNPLMRFDGYYFLSDWLEMPNLSSRSTLYWRYLCKHYLFGETQEHFIATTGERCWLALYGFATPIYRIVLYCSITYVAAQYYLLLGLMVMLWLLNVQLIKPAWQLLNYLFDSQSLGQQRKRALICSVSIFIFFILLLTAVPLPVKRTVPALVWQSEQGEIRAPANGFIDELMVAERQLVFDQQALFQLKDSILDADILVAAAKIAELRAEHGAARVESRAEAALLQEQIKTAEAELTRKKQMLTKLQVHTAIAGSFYLAAEVKNWQGKYVHQGDVIAYVLDSKKILIRAMVSQDDIGLVMDNTQSVKVRVSSWPGRTFDAQIQRRLPAASHQLPSPLLGTRYGGDIAIDGADETGSQALEPWFQVEISLPAQEMESWLGARAWVQFNLGNEPLAMQLYRGIRQLFMRSFTI
ncbi:MAG: HlyD family efflux transporter periplasmic adaptor subunit [Pseudomonadales bacterium]|nr:HlyD family efflux transporter periplasmic adaptor subunit [Pseudomonadales bacterium]